MVTENKINLFINQLTCGGGLCFYDKQTFSPHFLFFVTVALHLNYTIECIILIDIKGQYMQ